MKKFVRFPVIVYTFFAVTFLVWCFLSFVDINLHNGIGESYGCFSSWNLFILFNKIAGVE